MPSFSTQQDTTVCRLCSSRERHTDISLSLSLCFHQVTSHYTVHEQIRSMCIQKPRLKRPFIVRFGVTSELCAALCVVAVERVQLPVVSASSTVSPCVAVKGEEQWLFTLAAWCRKSGEIRRNEVYLPPSPRLSAALRWNAICMPWVNCTRAQFYNLYFSLYFCCSNPLVPCHCSDSALLLHYNVQHCPKANVPGSLL